MTHGFDRARSALACSLAVAAASAVLPVGAADSEEELAKKSLNPIAAMISLPLQLNYDSDIGPARQGEKWLLNVQPVVPVSINSDWNLISRTILPMVSQTDIVPGAGSKSGIGDIVQSLFFSPKAPTAAGWIWGAGPVALLPTGADGLSAEKWGLGPTAVLLKQEHGWTRGLLANHIWSVGGSGTQAISSTFVQPFLSYTTKSFTSFGINTESTYDWKAGQWSVPINLTVTQLLKVGGQPLTLQAGARYWAQAPGENGPTGWGARLALTFLFPN